MTMSYDENVDFYMNVQGLDRTEAESIAAKLARRDSQPAARYVCNDPEGAYEQMIREEAA